MNSIKKFMKNHQKEIIVTSIATIVTISAVVVARSYASKYSNMLAMHDAAFDILQNQLTTGEDAYTIVGEMLKNIQ